MMKRVDSVMSDEGGRLYSGNGDRDRGFNRISENFKYITNDQPIHIALRVDKDIKIVQLIQMICEVREVNIDLASKVSNICLYS